MAVGKVAVEAGAVTRRRVRWSAWLGVAVMLEEPFAVEQETAVGTKVSLVSVASGAGKRSMASRACRGSKPTAWLDAALAATWTINADARKELITATRTG